MRQSDESMRIVIPGGSGHIGTILARTLHRDGHDVTVLSRRRQSAPWRVQAWDGRHPGPWVRFLDGADAVVNLAGRSVNCRYSASNRTAILESRVEATRVVGEAIAQSSPPPRVWLQMSTATVYDHRYDAPSDERDGRIGGPKLEDADPRWTFSIDVVRAWEGAFHEAETPRTRKVALRTAILMSADPGGAFSTLYTLSRLGLGGTAGAGRQFVSWIHEQDFVRAIYWLLAHDAVDGIVNLAAPNPLPNAQFMRELRKAAGARLGVPASAWMLEIAAFFHRTETELLLKSRYVVPGRLLESGFTFEFPLWSAAARDLCARRQGRAAATE